MAFWVYEDWKAGPHMARIHRGNCAFCNDGKGEVSADQLKDAKWHGPFDSIGQATIALVKLEGVIERSECPCVRTERLQVAR